MNINCAFPKQIISPVSLRHEELLLLCYYDPDGISTVPETVAFMQQFSRFSMTVINMFEHGKNGYSLSLSPNFNLKKFDCIIIHNSLSYNVDNLRSLDRLLEFKIRDFNGVKVLLKQDENFRFKELAHYIGETKFDLIFTCLPKEALPIVYPSEIVGEPIFSRMLTGYVTPTLRNLPKVLEARPIDIGYRGSIQPLSFGRLAYEKRKIGDDVLNLKHTKDLTLDISSRWEDRLGSADWLHFLSSCKATLGAESGASIFDLDDDLSVRCSSAEMKYGSLSDDPEYCENFLNELSDIEGKIYYNQISPRHFEAAATRTLQIMYPGNYSHIFKKGKHYVELSRDYSNIDEVLEILNDDKKRQEIVECAHSEIINNKKYWIETFSKDFDSLVARMLLKKGLYKAPVLTIGRKKKNILLICGHKPSIDPRLDWVSQCAPDNLQVTQVGVLPVGSDEIRVNLNQNDRLVLSEPRMTYTNEMLMSWWVTSNNNPAGWAGLTEINFIASSLALDDYAFLDFYNAPKGSERVSSFKWYLQYILNTTATLVQQIDQLTGYQAIIATDLDSLPAALIIKGITGIPVIYDAHEYWPEADVDSLEFEKLFWVNMERRLVQQVDRCQTVSPGLAKLMSSQYGVPFDVVPNCEPLSSSLPPNLEKNLENDICRFIFQGNFAPKRGIDLLIDAWEKTEPGAILILRGPDSDYKNSMIERARKTGLLGTRIQFPPKVHENELVSAARNGEVGIIPYTPAGANYTHCCPNKTSQYMAAGLPILANKTSFVREIVDNSKCGLVIDFSKQSEIIKAVSWFLNNPDQRIVFGNRAEFYFNTQFNWNKVSVPMYKFIENFITENDVRPLRLFSNRKIEKLNIPVAHTISSIAETTSDKSIILVQKLWRKLPLEFRKNIGPKIRKLKSSL